MNRLLPKLSIHDKKSLQKSARNAQNLTIAIAGFCPKTKALEGLKIACRYTVKASFDFV